MTKEAGSSLPEKALGSAAEEFSTSSKGAGEVLGQAAIVGAETVLIAAKGAKALLAPISIMIWAYEKLEEKVIPRIQEKIAQIPKEHLQTPPLQIAGPTLEAAKYAVDEPNLIEMFASLVATAMDQRTSNDAHPAFIEIIKQITGDEAKIIKFLGSTNKSYPIVNLNAKNPKSIEYTVHIANITDVGDELGIASRRLMQSYIDNLARLRLIEIPYGISLADGALYKKIEEDAGLEKFRKTIHDEGNIPEFERGVIRITNLGRHFYRACVKDK